MTDELPIRTGSFFCFHLEQPMATSLGKVSEGKEGKRGSMGSQQKLSG